MKAHKDVTFCSFVFLCDCCWYSFLTHGRENAYFMKSQCNADKPMQKEWQTLPYPLKWDLPSMKSFWHMMWAHAKRSISRDTTITTTHLQCNIIYSSGTFWLAKNYCIGLNWSFFVTWKSYTTKQQIFSVIFIFLGIVGDFVHTKNIYTLRHSIYISSSCMIYHSMSRCLRKA